MSLPRKIFKNLGLSDKWELPSETALAVLLHLAEKGSPRLFVREHANSRLTVSLSNSETKHGWTSKVDVQRMLFAGFIEIDTIMSRTCSKGILAYRITERGREAIVQKLAYAEVESLLKSDVPLILLRLRRKYML